MKNKRWTKEQLLYLKSRYLRYSNTTLLKGVNARGPERTLKALIVKGGRLKLEEKIKPGYVRLSDVHPDKDKRGRSRVYYLCRDKAIADGVAIKAEFIHSRPYIVPEWWAEKYAEWYYKREEANREAKIWLTADEFGKFLNLKGDTIRKYCKGQSRPKKSIARFIKVRKKIMLKDGHKQWYYHPGDVDKLVKFYKTFVFKEG